MKLWHRIVLSVISCLLVALGTFTAVVTLFPGKKRKSSGKPAKIQATANKEMLLAVRETPEEAAERERKREEEREQWQEKTRQKHEELARKHREGAALRAQKWELAESMSEPHRMPESGEKPATLKPFAERVKDQRAAYDQRVKEMKEQYAERVKKQRAESEARVREMKARHAERVRQIQNGEE